MSMKFDVKAKDKDGVIAGAEMIVVRVWMNMIAWIAKRCGKFWNLLIVEIS